MVTLKAIIVGAPAALREQLEAMTGKMTLIGHLAALRPGPLTSTTASAKASLRAIARRWLDLNAEVKSHDAHLEGLVEPGAPTMIKAPGIKTGIAAEMLILAGDNPERIYSEAAFAKLCGACPIPASSGKTNRHRLNRGGHRQANAALHRVVICQCVPISPPSTTSGAVPPKARANRRSSAASSASWHGRPSAISAVPPSPPHQGKLLLDLHQCYG